MDMDRICIQTQKGENIYDITHKISMLTNRVNLQKEGVCCVFVKHTTAGIVLCENEKDLLFDLQRVIQTLLCDLEPFTHCGHGVANGRAHLLSTLVGCSVMVPVRGKQLDLGPFQRVMLLDFDPGRQREIRICFV